MSVIYRNTKNVIGTLLYGAGAIASEIITANTLKNILQEYFTISTSIDFINTHKTIKDQYLHAIRNMFVNTSIILYSLSRYYLTNWRGHKPVAIIGGLPLGTVEELSHAMSQDDLKYRSKGGFFLAHQPGGDQSLRIVGKALGANRFLFLTMVDFLFRYGNSRVMDMLLGKSNLISSISINTQSDLDVNPWKVFDEQSLDVGREEFHYTFPVITRDRIYTNMYIETYEFTESIENGMDVISFTLFFRKFEQLFPYKYSLIPREADNRPDLYFYKEDYEDETMNKLKKWDSTLQFSLSSAIILMRVGMMLTSNSPERTIAHVFGINLGSNEFGVNQNLLTGIAQKFDDIENGMDILTYTVANKEEIMQID